MTQHMHVDYPARPVELPLAASAVSGAFGPVHYPVALLLEDEPLIAMDVEMTLAGAGFAVHSIMSCEAALAWLKLGLPDVVIVDIELRDGPCTDVVARLTGAGIPFIVHSGDHPDLHAGTPFSQGGWVGKPASPQALLDAIHIAMTASLNTASG